MKTKKLLAMIMALCIVGGSSPVYNNFLADYSITANAEHTNAIDGGISENGIKFIKVEIFNDDGEVIGGYMTVAGYAGSSKDVEIPSSFEGLPVTKIHNFCFRDKDIESVIIPDSVVEIEEESFAGTNLTSVEIPASVVKIGIGAFGNCSNLETVKLNEGLITIGSVEAGYGDGVFHDCDKLSTINIPESVELIGKGTFSECKSLKSIELPKTDHNLELGDCLFWNAGLESIVIPSNVVTRTTIQKEIPNDDGEIETIEEEIIEKGLSTQLFSGCRAVVIDPETEEFVKDEYGNYVYTGLKSITLPEGMEVIKWGAFQQCSALEEIIIPESVTRIEECVFESCLSAHIVIKNLNTKVGEQTQEQESGRLGDAMGNISAYGEHSYYATVIEAKAYKDDGTITDAKRFADENGYLFIDVDNPPVFGDANVDEKVTIADAVAILQFSANSRKYPLSEKGYDNADVFNRNDGVTAMDALSIQKYDAQVLKSLPHTVSVKTYETENE